MNIPTIAPADARRRLVGGSAILVDIREPMEHAREAIRGARLEPLSALNPGNLAAAAGAGAKAVIFHCQSGKHTSDNTARLASCGAVEMYLLEGGLLGWKAAGYSTRTNRGKARICNRASGKLKLSEARRYAFWLFGGGRS
jgi:rhodanese-related sulfurtransferase